MKFGEWRESRCLVKIVKVSGAILESTFLPHDDANTRVRKVVMFVALLFTGITSIVSVTISLLSSGLHARDYSILAWIFSSLAGAVYMRVTRSCTHAFVAFILSIGCGVIMWADLMSASAPSASIRTWPTFIMVVDVMFMTNAPFSHTAGTVAVVVVWLLLVVCEQWLRFGLFDLPVERDYAERRSHMCDCEFPPCAATFAYSFRSVFFSVTVFIFDVLVTRRFAVDLREEQALTDASIAAAESVASRLASFDLTAAEQELSSIDASALHPQMYSALRQLLSNLKTFRPFLPDALLYDMQMYGSGGTGGPDSTGNNGNGAGYIGREGGAGGGKPKVSAPGAETQRAAIVFTDIVDSTSLWEQYPSDMVQAIKLHNSIVRAVIRDTGGYEVKTVGDSFMVAYSRAEEALSFALRVHRSLLAEEAWPENLLRHACCRRDPQDLWGGLTVRIGINEGAVELDENPVTGRIDYFGTTVNVASRAESMSMQGAVALPEWLLAQVSQRILLDTHTQSLGPVKLKGIADAVCLASLYPSELAGRRFDTHPRGGGGGGASSGSGAAPVVPVDPALPLFAVEVASVSGGPLHGSPLQELGEGGLDSRSGSLLGTSELVGAAAPAATTGGGSGGVRGLSPRRSPSAKSAGESRSGPELRCASAATVATVEVIPTLMLELLFPWNKLLCFVVTSVERYQGKVVGVSGNVTTCTWNTIQPCVAHVDSFYKFATLLSAKMYDGSPAFAVGGATGEAVYGFVGNSKHKFANVAGPCVRASRQLVEAARRGRCTLFVNLLPQSALPLYVRKKLIPYDKVCSSGPGGGVVTDKSEDVTLAGSVVEVVFDPQDTHDIDNDDSSGSSRLLEHSL